MARTHKARAAAQARKAKHLKTKVKEYILEHGGREHGIAGLSGFYDYALPTDLGELLISVHDGNAIVYSRFEDVPRAVVKLSSFAVNRHTGKWNFHPPEEWSVDDVFEEWMRRMSPIMQERESKP